MNSRVRPVGRWIPTASLAALIGLLAGCYSVPVTGRKAFNLIPEDQAASLGADSYRQVLSSNKIITRGPDYDEVLRVGRRIAAASDEPGLQWEFNLIDDPKTVNAFCLPGGKVAVYSGILPVARNEAGLACVMAHEIGHAIARHGSERMTEQLMVQVGQAGLAAALQSKSPETQQLVLSAYGAGGTVGVLLPFSRKQESEADHIGLIYMARAGYDPHEAPEFWRRMVQSSAGQQRPPELLSTHPAPEDRVQQLEQLIPEAMKEYHPR